MSKSPKFCAGDIIEWVGHKSYPNYQYDLITDVNTFEYDMHSYWGLIPRIGTVDINGIDNYHELYTSIFREDE